MRLLLLGVNHRTAPVELRERVAVAGEQLEATLHDLRRRYPQCECVLLSTCNRTELYIARPTHAPPTVDGLRTFLAERSGVGFDELGPASIHREQEQVVQHLFRVSCGFDSMVVGEPQILGQVKRAYQAANDAGVVGPVLHRVFQQAVATAKRVRTRCGLDAARAPAPGSGAPESTRIPASAPISVASVAVDFARQIFESFGDKTIVGIGAGDMAKATLRHLLRLSPGRLWIVNRSLDKAIGLAESLQLSPAIGGARPWDQLDELLVEADAVLTSTGAREPVVTAEQFRPLLRRRRNRPLFIVDIAVPRDVEPAVGGLGNVYLYNIDDLQRVVSANLGQRRDLVQQCEGELAETASLCYRQIQHRDLGHLIRQLRHQLHDIGDAERERTARKLASLRPDEADALSALLDEHTRRVINKILHLPLSQLDHKDPDAPLAFYAAALRRLFQLEDASPDAGPETPPQSRRAGKDPGSNNDTPIHPDLRQGSGPASPPPDR